MDPLPTRCTNVTAFAVLVKSGISASMAAKKKTGTEQSIVRSARAVARHFAVSERTVRRWIAEGMPRDGSNYDLNAIEAWRAESKFVSSGTDWKIEKEKEQALTARFKRRQLEAGLIEVSETEAVIAAIITAITQAFLPIPKQLAPLLVPLSPERVDKVLTKHITEKAARSKIVKQIVPLNQTEVHDLIDREVRTILDQLTTQDYPPWQRAVQQLEKAESPASL